MAKRARTTDPFDDPDHGPDRHFRLYFYAAILQLRDRLLRLDFAEALERFPFLDMYFGELEGTRMADARPGVAVGRWKRRLEEWERDVEGRLPLVELGSAAGLDQLALSLLFMIGLPEEDPRFGEVFEALHGLPGQHRATAGMLAGWAADPAERSAVRGALHALLETGIVEVANPDAPRAEWGLQPQPVIWDAIRGDVRTEMASWARYEPPETLPQTGDLILPEALRARLRTLPGLFLEGGARCLIVRGPEASGRRTMIKAVAAGMGRGVVALTGLGGGDDDRWKIAGPLATVLHALPMVALDPAPGGTAEVPAIPALDGPIGLTLPTHGGASGGGTEGAVTLEVPMPDVAGRIRHWQAALEDRAAGDTTALAEHYRMTGGTIRRVAAMALAEAAADGREAPTADDVRRTSRTLHAELLDTLAARVPVAGGWGDLVVSAATRHELLLLEQRCRRRELLGGVLPGAYGTQLGAGVRAMFTGASGTGKTLAARLLASVLHKDLYRLDLSAVVNKYLGETEKNVDRVLGRAERLDVVLLIDEGDSLLSKRTDVQTSNDRYANLETNYLLQRLESFEGILVVTTNAEQRVDEAFERRLDVIVDFPDPGPVERWAIWGLHLPNDHLVAEEFLQEVSARCALSGGQIRNAVVHASLLALGEGAAVGTSHLDAAVRREYRKMGALCPLRPVLPADA